jgi:hypothetical protein
MTQTFDEYISANWPAGVPEECTKLINNQDCLERGCPTPRAECCDSCNAYADLCEQYYRQDQLRPDSDDQKGGSR